MASGAAHSMTRAPSPSTRCRQTGRGDPASRCLLQLGGEWRGMKGRYDYRDQVEFDMLFLVPGAPTETSRARQMGARPDGDQVGAYANLRVDILRSVTAEVGVRWDKETLSPDHNDQVSPRLSLLFAPGERIPGARQLGPLLSDTGGERAADFGRRESNSCRPSVPIIWSPASSIGIRMAWACASRPTARSTGRSARASRIC